VLFLVDGCYVIVTIIKTTDEFRNVSVTLPSAGMHMPWVTYLRLTWPRAGWACRRTCCCCDRPTIFTSGGVVPV